LKDLYLLDASVTETNAVKLKFTSSDGENREIVDSKYKPYFLSTYPLSPEENGVLKLFSGDVQTVEKTDIFTGEKRALAKVSWPNSRIATKTIKEFRHVWESGIDFPKSYVYDQGLIFGAIHSNESLKPVFNIADESWKGFDETFEEVKSQDPLKYTQIMYWFGLLTQPVPTSALEFFGGREADSEKVYAAWLLARIANIPLSEALGSKRVSDWLKSMIYTHLRKSGFLIPTAEELTRGLPTHRVTGALTVTPKAGIYFNTVVCDFESLYPSCIDSFNLSYETVNCGHADCARNKIPDFDGNVCTKRRGFYSVLVGALKELRIKLFKPASKNSSLTEEERKRATAAAKLLKLILVSSYGVTVRIHGLACPPLAESITGYGRYVLRESWQMAENNGLRPLYGDTDSLFLDNVSDKQVEWLINAAKEKFHLDLAIEKKYNICVLPKAKKAYFGILADGTPDIKGVTAIKSNSPGYINKVFLQCVKKLAEVRSLDEFEHAKKAIKEVVKTAVADLKSRKISLENLTYSVRLFFDPNEKITDMKTTAQPYQCAIQLVDSGRKLQRWDTVSFIKVKPFKYKEKTFTVKPAEFVRNLADINVEDYVRNLLTALNQTFEPMGIKLEIQRDTEISRWLTS
jgi:DNA polymerase elongation subunit (family B)